MKTRIDTRNPSQPLSTNAFDALSDLGSSLPSVPRSTPEPSTAKTDKPRAPGMRLEVRREKSGRGGKTVTTISGLASLDPNRRRNLLRDLKTRCGTGGTDKGTSIEIQGDQRETVMAFLRDAGFRPVAAGG